MSRDPYYSNFFFRSLLVILLVVFLAISLFNLSLIFLDFQISRQARVWEKMPALARVVIDFGNQKKRVFEGEVPPEGLTLFEALTYIAEIGNLSMSFRHSEEGGVYLTAIGSLPNNDNHFWEVRLEKSGWSNFIQRVDLRRIYLEKGEVAYLIYH